MRRNAFLLLVLLSFGAVTQEARARTPRPFPAGHRDGMTFNWPFAEMNKEKLNQLLDRIAETGANHLTIPFYGCQPDGQSNEVGSCAIVPESIPIEQAKGAMAKGFYVTFLPIVLTPTGEWRGEFQPTNRARWFETYTLWINHVAAIAESMKMQDFVAASEFKFLYRFGEDWKKVLIAVRNVFSGPVIVTANWDEPDLTFWDESDAFGLSNYKPLSGAKDPTQEELNKTAVFNRDFFVGKAKKYNRPFYMTEVGYPSLPTAAAKPWYYVRKEEERISDPDLQAKCMASFVYAWAQEQNLPHVGFWDTSDPSNPYTAYNFEVIGKPVESEVRKFFEKRDVRHNSAEDIDGRILTYR